MTTPRHVSARTENIFHLIILINRVGDCMRHNFIHHAFIESRQYFFGFLHPTFTEIKPAALENLFVHLVAEVFQGEFYFSHRTKLVTECILTKSDQAFSITTAYPCPTPIHIVTNANFLFCSCNSIAAEFRIRAPLMPNG